MNFDQTLPKIKIPGSKSISNRLLLLAAVLNIPIKADNFLLCNDTQVFMNFLRQMGHDINLSCNNSIHISPRKDNNNRHFIIDVQDCGTAARFLIAFCSVIKGTFEITGSERMQQRPVAPLASALQDNGSKIEYLNKEGFLPIKIEGGYITDEHFVIKSSVSSQFASALLLVSPLIKNFTLTIEGQISSFPYINMTVAMLNEFGIKFKSKDNFYKLDNFTSLKSINYQVEGDYSSASYLMAIGLLHRGACLYPLKINSIQGDYKIVEILQRMGANIKHVNNNIYISPSKLTGIDIDMNDYPDLVPTIACLGLFCTSPIFIRNISHLRFKESDRITCLGTELRKTGAMIEWDGSSITVHPLSKDPGPITLFTYNDHRLVMAFSIIKSIYKNIEIDGKKAAMKSYPTFFTDYKSIINN